MILAKLFRIALYRDLIQLPDGAYGRTTDAYETGCLHATAFGIPIPVRLALMLCYPFAPRTWSCS